MKNKKLVQIGGIMLMMLLACSYELAFSQNVVPTPIATLMDKSKATNNLPAIIDNSGNNRGAGFNGQYVFVASRQNGNHVYYWDISNPGATPLELNVTGISGGTFTLSDLTVVGDHIFACNMVMPGTFKVYYWAGVSSSPSTVILSYNSGSVRLGDAFTVIGDPATNAKLIVSGHGTKNFYVWDIVNAAIPNTTPAVYTYNDIVNNNFGRITKVPNEDRYLASGSGYGLLLLDNQMNVLTSVPAAFFPYWSMYPTIFYFKGHRYLAYHQVDNRTPTFNTLHILDINNGATSLEALQSLAGSTFASRVVYSISLGNIANGNASVSLDIVKDPSGNVTFSAYSAGNGFLVQKIGNLVPPGSISGLKYNDLNKNGIKDEGEPGLDGWTIGIFGGMQTSTVTTDTSGEYAFGDLQPGIYDVFEIQQPCWEQTSLPGVYSITLTSEQHITGIDFGNRFTGCDYGDAPEDALAYPGKGTIGMFPTCLDLNYGYIRHSLSGSYFGFFADPESDGNGGNCPAFNPDQYNQDECKNDEDAGLIKPGAFTIVGSTGEEVVEPCPISGNEALGSACSGVKWGEEIDIIVVNQNSGQNAVYVNLLIDWNQDGVWGGTVTCTTNDVPEHVLQNFAVNFGFNGTLSQLAPPDFFIGPNPGYVWARFSVTDIPVNPGWDGSGVFADGETEDYLFKILLPEVLNLNNLTLPELTDTCYDALNTIVISDFIVQPNATVNLVTGFNVMMLPGTHFTDGSNVHAFIDLSGSYCNNEKSIVSSDKVGEQLTTELKSADAFFIVYPNPTTGQFMLELVEFDDMRTIRVEIFSMLGESIVNTELPTSKQYTFDLKNRQAGLYLIRITQGGKTGFGKIIKN